MTFNEQFFDASVRHQIDLLRFGSGVARKVNGLLDETRADLRRQVERRLGKVTGITGSSLKRLRELERAIDQTRSGAWNDVTESWTRTATDIALEEPLFVAGVVTRILPVELDLVQPSPATLRALVTSRPFHGRVLKGWAQNTQRADLLRIHQQIRIGMVQGEGSRDIANRVFGERGAMKATRAQVDAVTRTVINHVSNAAQREFLQANADLFSVERFVATLDARTTAICRSLDGNEYPVGKGPVLPLHFNERSTRVGVFDGEVVGERPFRAGTQQQMLREYSTQHGLGKVTSRDDLPRGHKRAFDEFSRRRMRELTGQVPAKTTYQEWLKGQPAEIQDDILGPTRAKLFREGGLTLDRFVNREGDELTLEELRQRNRAAWERAGLGGSGADRRIEEQRRREAEEDDRRRRENAERLRREADEAERRQREERERREAARGAEQDRRRQAEEGSRRARERADEQLSRAARAVEWEAPEEWRVPVAAALDRAGAGRMQEIGLRPLDGLRVVDGPAKPGANGVYQVSIKKVVAGAPSKRDLEFQATLAAGQKDSLRGAYSTAYLSTNPANSAAATAVHEFGHHLHYEFRARGKLLGDQRLLGADRTIQDTYRQTVTERRPPGASGRADKDPAGRAPTRYARYDYQEFWSESFALYHTDRAWLQREKPESFAMVETVLELIGLK